jgi:hypothetical protein
VVDEAPVLVVALDLIVFVELLLRVQPEGQAAAVDFLDLVAADGARAVSVPALDVAGRSDGWVGQRVPSWSRTFSLLRITQSDSS